MKRRAFIGSAVSGMLAACQGRSETVPSSGAKVRLAGMTARDGLASAQSAATRSIRNDIEYGKV